MIGISGTVPINGGRGRATLQCVWSIHRIDQQLGRYLDINSAWRDPQEQEQLYQAYRRYVNGTGPWAPIALRPEESVHCDGEAIDTDDNNAAMTRILNANGWFHTVFRNGVLVEPWHYEYDYKRDKYFGGSPAGNGSTPIEEEDVVTEQDKKDIAREVWAFIIGGDGGTGPGMEAWRRISWMNSDTAYLRGQGKESVIISYNGPGRNGIYLAAPGFWHQFTGEEWTQFQAHGLNKGIRVITPGNDRDFDVLKATYLYNAATAPKA